MTSGVRTEVRKRLISAGRYVQVVTLNTLWNGNELTARQELAGELLDEQGGEVVLLQEIPTGDLEASLERICRAGGYQIAAIGRGEGACSTAILSRHGGVMEEPIVYEGRERRYSNAVAVVEIRGQAIRFCSAHQPWGGLMEMERTSAARELNRELTTRGSVEGCVLGGDFNALEASESIRYLTGLHPVDGECAQWTDAWGAAGVGEGATSSPSNPWAIQVAEQHGFTEPDLMPERRIDYIFVHGYAHGRLLTPLETKVVKRVRGAAFYPSDHWAVASKLYLP